TLFVQDFHPFTAPISPAHGDAVMSKTRYRVMIPIRRAPHQTPFWQRIGTGFENPAKNGGAPSISVRLDSLPLGGELVLFAEGDGEATKEAQIRASTLRDGEPSQVA